MPLMTSWSALHAAPERWARFPGRVHGERDDAATLTFDDGPDPEGTPAVLEALAAEGARATFFLLGEQLMKAPRLGRLIREGGHEIALHGYAHTPHDELFPGQARDDLARGLGALEAGTATRARWFRPPGGLLSEASFGACEHLALEPVYWSAWGLDAEALPAARVAEIAAADLAAGAIVLLHDSARYTARPDASATAEAVHLVAQAARDRGLALVTLGQAVAPEPG